MGSKSDDPGTTRPSQQSFNPMTPTAAFSDPEFRIALEKMIEAFVRRYVGAERPLTTDRGSLISRFEPQPDEPESGPWGNRTWSERYSGLTADQFRAGEKGSKGLPRDDTSSVDDAERKEGYGRAGVQGVTSLERVPVRNQNIARPTTNI